MPSGCQIFSYRSALIGLEPSYLGTSAEPPDRTCKRCRCSRTRACSRSLDR
jgi:hypothetical protein